MLWPSFFLLIIGLVLVRRRLSPRALFVIGLGFVGIVFPLYEYAWFGATLAEPSEAPGTDASIMYVSVFLLAYALAFEIAFTTELLCTSYRVPKERVARWEIVVAIAIGGVSSSVAAWLARSFVSAGYALAVLVIHCGLQPFKDDDDDVSSRWRVPWVPRVVSSIVGVNILFALDALALLAVTTTTFVLVSASTLAAIALRGLSVATIERWRPSPRAYGVVLLVAGALLYAREQVRVPHVLVLAAILCGYAAASARR